MPKLINRNLTAFTLDLKKSLLTGAMMEDFRVGSGYEGLMGQDPKIASFHLGGAVCFNLGLEVVGKTRIVNEGNRLYAA